jgi:hypothetical protein
MFHTSAPLLPKEVCNKIGLWNENLHGCDEIEYFFRLKSIVGKGDYIDEYLSDVRIHNVDHVSGKGSLLNAKASFETLKMFYTQLLGNSIQTKHNKDQEFEALALFGADVFCKNHGLNLAENCSEIIKIMCITTQKTHKKIVFMIISLAFKLGIGMKLSYLFCKLR